MKNYILFISLLACFSASQLHGQIKSNIAVPTLLLHQIQTEYIPSNYMFIGLAASQLPSQLIDMELSSVSIVSEMNAIELMHVEKEPVPALTLKELANQTDNLEAQKLAIMAQSRHRHGTALAIAGGLTIMTGMGLLIYSGGDFAGLAVSGVFGIVGVGILVPGFVLISSSEKLHRKAFYLYNQKVPQLNAQNTGIGLSISF